jgi:hypothetical protein
LVIDTSLNRQNAAHAYFLYVARTGRGGMYETPSRTKQEPFVGLILEQITAEPKGAELIEAVRKLPKNDLK